MADSVPTKAGTGLSGDDFLGVVIATTVGVILLVLGLLFMTSNNHTNDLASFRCGIALCVLAAVCFVATIVVVFTAHFKAAQDQQPTAVTEPVS